MTASPRTRRRAPIALATAALAATTAGATAASAAPAASVKAASPSAAPSVARTKAAPIRTPIDLAQGATRGHLVRPATDLGAGSSAASDAVRLPFHTGSKEIGAHYVYYAPMYWTSSQPAQDPTTNASTYVARSGAYWNDAADGQVSVFLGWAEDWRHINLTSSEIATCDIAAIWREASKNITGGRPNDHVLFNLPYNPACDWTDIQYVGTSPKGYGVSITNGLIVPKDDVINRAILHNDWVVGTDQVLCTDSAGKRVPLSLTPEKSCERVAYNDPWSPAGWLPFGYGHVGMPHAKEMLDFLAFDAGNYEIIPAGGPDRTLDLYRLQGPSGNVQMVTCTLDGYRYDLEYRVSTGLESWTDDQTYDSAGVTRTAPGGGVILTQTKLPDAKYIYDSNLIDFHTTTSDTVTQRHPGLETGESFTAPLGIFKIAVGAADQTRAQVTVSFPSLTKVARWSGKDRYDASAAISAKTFAPGVTTAYLASGEIYTDALSGAPVAGMTRGPVLLTARDALPSAISTELKRLRPGRIVILGGPNTITENVAAAAASATGAAIERWSGKDRFETSAAISATSYEPGVDTAYVASGRVFPDALSGAPVAGRDKNPMLLVDTKAIPPSIAAELTRLQPQRIVVLGGVNTITPEVEAALAAYAPTVERYAGADRFAASAAISAANYDPGVNTAYVASGRVYTDALSGAPVAGMTAGPVVLTDTTTLPAASAAELARLKPTKIVVLGGPNTISYAVQAQLADYLAK
ncbi:MAG TPA: cell wall-binding repeat-containing protein [Tetrasphaera sp.]|uniref:cell wall-binding repeat-containing protein n=1 Tax=Nostocoides sp. TaxID=1917966 RepID=UPI002C3EA5AB|nr:cell wall-binding repeat-containing protein [Tetrasphaera sp.]HNQ06654.1 cell wall-binding repeat-containing protein [Tetrasphaera sp.]